MGGSNQPVEKKGGEKKSVTRTSDAGQCRKRTVGEKKGKGERKRGVGWSRREMKKEAFFLEKKRGKQNESDDDPWVSS